MDAGPKEAVAENLREFSVVSKQTVGTGQLRQSLPPVPSWIDGAALDHAQGHVATYANIFIGDELALREFSVVSKQTVGTGQLRQSLPPVPSWIDGAALDHAQGHVATYANIFIGDELANRTETCNHTSKQNKANRIPKTCENALAPGPRVRTTYCQSRKAN